MLEKDGGSRCEAMEVLPKEEDGGWLYKPLKGQVMEGPQRERLDLGKELSRRLKPGRKCLAQPECLRG